MLKTIPSDSRGSANLGWLDTKFSFSFADYHDPERMGFGSLRVINEDRIKPGTGFGMHPHRDMEIVTYIIDGELEHKDSMGNGSRIRAGELQRMTAGTGVLHSEFNPSDTQTHLLQIWIIPDATGLQPAYEQKLFAREDKLNKWCLLASRDGRTGSLTVHQNIDLLTTLLDEGRSIDYDFAAGRRAYLQLVRGQVRIGTSVLKDGDGIEIENTDTIRIQADEPSEMLLFDMA